MKKIKGHFWSSTPSDRIPSHQTRASRSLCKSCMDPGGSGKELVGKGSGTVRARLAQVQFYKRNPLKQNLRKSQNVELISFKAIAFVKLNPELVLHVLYQSLSRPIPYRSLRGPYKIYTASAKRELDGIGWGGVGWDGTGYVLGPSIFFKLCKYTDKV